MSSHLGFVKLISIKIKIALEKCTHPYDETQGLKEQLNTSTFDSFRQRVFVRGEIENNKRRRKQRRR